ncbi:hypothetical protein MIMGU_mgv1a015659mg [Erythranthe guttata]|uniref:Uncharacterized protein n=1 Tax=Erythranthe guttata TaxID=4155 RepID=A0A022R4R1_ERYGU|nr:hypothetical protein MIMGU_mgv1a015659mg [Erythranthe guttata]
MANQIAPAAPGEGYVTEMGLAVNVPAVEAVFGAPTEEQMLNEHRRLVSIDRAQTLSVKEFPGHPFPQPPAVQNVVFDNNNYNVNTSPPDHLIPADLHALHAVSTGTVVLARDRLRAIYWFYNDPRLAIGENATRVQCGLAVAALLGFLMH